MLVLRKSCRPILIARSFCAPAVEAATSSVSGNKVEKKVQNVAKKTGEKKKKPKIRFPRQNVFDGMAALLENRVPKANFDETVEIAVNLGVDPRKPNQAVKGVATLPNGSGKKVRVGVFAKGADAQAATEAGADVVGAEDLIARVQSGDVPFDRVIATPELMSLVSKIGKILGPKGLMPNPKMGTVTKDVGKAIKAAKAGAVQFRVEKKGIVQAGIGKVSFSKEALLENFKSFMIAISDVKPEGFKGKYITNVTLSSTMGPGIPLETANVDPSNGRFMLDPSILREI